MSKAWSDIVRVTTAPTVDGVTVTASADGIFLPAADAESLAANGDAVVQVESLDELENGTFSHGHGKLRISDGAMKVLVEYGQAYARSVVDEGQEGDLVRVRIAATELELADDAVVGNQVVVNAGDAAQLFGLNPRQRSRLLAGRPVTIRDGARAIRFVPRSNAQYGSAKGPLGGKGDDASDFGVYIPDMGWGSPVRPLPRYEIGLATAIVQEWSLLGYERGPLVGSVVLEPGAEATLEVFMPWERLRVEREEQTGTTFKRSKEMNALSRTTSRIAVDAVMELETPTTLKAARQYPLKRSPRS